ncbi:unnamed protein product [Didymodactylos carnosus]|uniref:AAA+ ATPase domain-containing protein n=1 Tax=Didymodactylos carnosus TaxID=1234261 RepID=A0A8S2D047_9BILA|nr:unnamed protein product [Didymodactylos carnosus]CAF3591125.1 unnamed protein product [Didymodactylos carnosus]
MTVQETDTDFYALYDSGMGDDFKIQMLLPNDVKCEFDVVASIPLNMSKDYPFVSKFYHYKLKSGYSKSPSFPYLCQYFMRVSQSKSYQPTYHFEDKTERMLDTRQHCYYIFSLHFEKSGWSHLSTCPGESVPLFHQLWRFTYLIIVMNKLNTFSSFITQFLQQSKEYIDYNDMTKIFKQCLKNICLIQDEISSNPNAISALICMFGLMEINTSNITPVCEEAKSLITKVLRAFLTHMDSVLEQYRDHIDCGLINLLFIEILTKNIDADIDTISILRKIPIRQHDIVERLIQKLFNNKPLIKRENWLELFTLKKDKIVPIECLPMIATLKDYMTYVTSIVSQEQDKNTEENLRMELSLTFNDLLSKRQLEINCRSIIYILKALYEQINDSLIARINHYVFESSEELRIQIQNYLISSEAFSLEPDEINDLFRYYNPYILEKVDDKTTYLVRHLNRTSTAKSNRTIEFYIKWFENFICDQHYTQTTQEFENFQRLFDAWLQQIKQNSSSFDNVLKSIDQLLNKLSCSDKRMIYVVESILTLCFESKKMEVSSMNIICEHVKNNNFLNEYKIIYMKTIIEPNINKLKQMSIDNPLYELLQNYKIKSNDILKQLIELCIKKITLDKHYVTNDILVADRQSFVSTILFEPCFKGTTVYQTIINLLLEQLNTWVKDGLKYEDLQRVSRYNDNQKVNFTKIWDDVNLYAKDKTDVTQLIKSTVKEMDDKIKIIDVIDVCLKQYCSNSSDIDAYKLALNDVTKKINDEPIRSVKISDCLLQILPFAIEIIPYVKSTTWHRYQRKNSINQSTCLTDMIAIRNLFKRFHDELEKVSFQWQTMTLEQIVRQFETIGSSIDTELNLLKTLIPSLGFSPIIHYWKERDYNNKVCHGCLIIISFYQLSDKENDYYLTVFNNLLSLTEQTTGELCYQYYQDYCDKFSSQHTKLLLDLCARYYTANELINFLSNRTENDMNNLREGANDNDDTMITAENVGDFELLHSFLHRMKQSNILTFDDFIQTALPLVHTDRTIVQKLGACTSLLSGLQQLFLELTDKQESKRRIIFLIVAQSSIQFEKTSQKNIDVCINAVAKSSSSNDNSFNYLEICELRDRARLIEYSNNQQMKPTTEMNKDLEIKMLHDFVQFVNVIEELLKQLNELAMMGYPTVEQLCNRVFECVKCNYSELEQFSFSTYEILGKWKGKVNEIYRVYPNLTYFFGIQFWILEEYLSQMRTLDEKHPGYHLLKYLGNPNLFYYPASILNKSLNAEERLENVGKTITDPQFDSKQQQTSITLATKNILIVETSNQGLYRGIISLARSNIDTLRMNQLLFCTTDTTWIEIQSFIYRCMYSTCDFLYQIVQPELLSFYIQDQACRLIKELMEEDDTKQFHLALITTDIRIHLVNGLIYTDTAKFVHDTELINENQLTELIRRKVKHCQVYSSKITGQGKTETIQKFIHQLGKNCVKFPLSGDLNLDQIARRLLNYGPVLKTFAIHFDVGVVNDINLLNKVLFSLCFLRSYCFSDTYIHIPDETMLCFELDSFYYENEQYEIILFKYLTDTVTVKFDLNEIILNPKIEFVAKYLSAIENKTIQHKDINLEDVDTIDKHTCIRLLRTYFLKDKNKNYLTWTQLHIFISVFYTLFNGFSKCGYFLVDLIPTRNLRMDIVMALVQSANQFTIMSVENVRKRQQNPLLQYSNETLTDTIVRWSETQPFTLVFTDTHDPIFVYKTLNDVPNALIQYLEIYQRSAGRQTMNDENIRYDLRIAQLLETEYVITADNFIKMLLIYLRAQSGLPILIMGETGCGKTALITFLCQKILDDELEVLRIHAGLTSSQIIDKMEQFIAKATTFIAPKRLWIFFDEFNTTENIGLIKEITCERTLLGKSLPNNLVLLGACNPSRMKMKRDGNAVADGNEIGLSIDRYEMQQLTNGDRLLYTVVPIPETMIEHIWDFGFLTPLAERKYIETIIGRCEGGLVGDKNWYNTIVTLICESQSHMRRMEDVSSVSLRDVVRYRQLYNWFHKSIRHRRVAIRSPLTVEVRAALLALLFCYYLRLYSSRDKQQYRELLESNLPDHLKNLNIEKLLEDEENDFIKRMILPRGTAKNHALCNNIFTVLICIINHIPIIVCGKPGCSKTSAVQIVLNNIKGKKSNDKYFQTLPELRPVSYQGSKTCTSESIEKVFERAKKINEIKSDTNLLSVIVFDEIGLAELSPYNPLKVLHSELEIENCKYGFVGITNYRLDASKMNRLLFLACPDPDVDDLSLTGQIIRNSLTDNTIYLTDETMLNLANAYSDLFMSLKREKRNENYFGLRDYYSLIKGIVKEFDDEMTDEFAQSKQYEIIRKQMKINFDGIIDGSVYMWKSFCEYLNRNEMINHYQPPHVKQYIDHSLSHRNGRYLMLISETESLFDYIERYLNKHENNVRTLIGSQMLNDLNKESYGYRVLMNIILYAETNITLILRKMDHLYGTLYDLFNQNFSLYGERKYCRIALGATYHPRCLVNDQFYCVILVNAKDVEKAAAPFLNRFEKHVIHFYDLVTSQQLKITDTLLSWINNLLHLQSIPKHFLLAQHMIVNFSCDYVCNLVLDACEKYGSDNEIDENMVAEYCVEHFLRSSTQDFPLILALNNNIHEDLIARYYQMKSKQHFRQLIHETIVSVKQIIYTYTQIYEKINYPTDSDDTIEEIKLANFTSELELTNKLKQFIQATNVKFLCVRVDYHNERQHILTLKHCVMNVFNEFVQGGQQQQKTDLSSKNIWILFHLQRNLLNNEKNDVLFNGWSVDMIDDLNENSEKVRITANILQNPTYQDVMKDAQYSASGFMFPELLDRCLSKFRYTITNTSLQMNINTRRDNLLQSLINGQFQTIVGEKIEYLIKNCQQQLFSSDDWRKDLISNGTIAATSRSFQHAFQLTLTYFYDTYFLVLFSYLERTAMIDAYLFIQEHDTSGLYNQIWLQCLDLIIDKITNLTRLNVNEYIEIPLVFGLQFPYSPVEYKILTQISDDLRDERINVTMALKQLEKKSVYLQEHFYPQHIMTNDYLFQQYYHDQILLFLDQHKIQSLSVNFVLQLLRNYPTPEDKTQYFLVHRMELLQLLQVFENGACLLNNDEHAMMNLIDQSNFIIDEQNVQEQRRNLFTMVLADNKQYYQILPESSEKILFDLSDGDPFIENSLNNLIHVIKGFHVIQNCNDISNLSTIYNRIVQSIKSLDRYLVNNLEELQPLISLLQAIELLSRNPLETFRSVFNYISQNVNIFQSCQLIHEFIQFLRNKICQDSDRDDQSINRIMTKLEAELLRNWIIDHQTNYCELLDMLNDDTSHLWRYGAKIMSYIDREILHLCESVTNEHGKIEYTDMLTELEHHLQQQNNGNKLIRIYTTYIYMNLKLTVSKSTIDETLTHDYKYFEQNFLQLQELIARSPNRYVLLISLIAWLKFYLELYAYALNQDSKSDIMKQIDQFLCNQSSAILLCSSLKIFIVKQMLYFTKDKNINHLRTAFKNRNVKWINEFLRQDATSNQLPTIDMYLPFFSLSSIDYDNVNSILKSKSVERIKDLMIECQKNNRLTYCFYIWFIQYYSQFYTNSLVVDKQFLTFIEDDLKTDLCFYFEPIGYRFILELCKNFERNSYFHLHPEIISEQVHYRLLALNLFVLLLASRSLSSTESTFMSSLLFNETNKIPVSYVQHINRRCLLGLYIEDRVVKQMLYVKQSVQERLVTGQIYMEDGRFIYRCSKNCFYTYFFDNCGAPVARTRCPWCNAEIGAQAPHILLQRSPPQIQMSIQDGFQFIDEYIQNFNRTDRYGYHNSTTAEHSTVNEKYDHLNKTMSFRLLHMFTHSMLILLYEMKYLSETDLIELTKHKIDTTSSVNVYLKNHFEKDCQLVYEILNNKDHTGHIWLYKLFNHTLDILQLPGILNTNNNVIHFEKQFEETVLFSHIESVITEIDEYKTIYIQYVRQRKSEELNDFIDELIENNEKYPLLQYLNVTNTQCTIDDFNSKLQMTVRDSDLYYPITSFILRRLNECQNIKHLFPIVRFTNYLLQKFNHRITRNDAATYPIAFYLNNTKENPDEHDQRLFRQLFDDFKEAWFQLKLDEVAYGCQVRPFHLDPNTKDGFEKETKLAYVLLNTTKDDSSIILAGCLIKLAQYQNDIVGHFIQKTINSNDQNTRHIQQQQTIQNVKNEQLFQMDSDNFLQLLYDDGFVIDYNYGKSKSILYDFDEIEIKLKHLIEHLCVFDLTKFTFLNYQHELFNEDSTLITDIRNRIRQELLTNDEKAKLHLLLTNMKPDAILHYIGSLDYIFTYLRNLISDDNTMTIQVFVEKCIKYNTNILRQQQLFSTIQIKYIISLYELIEEIVFDKIMKNYIKQELDEISFTKQEIQEVIEQFSKETYLNEKMSQSMRDVNVWINVLKRLIIRILIPVVDLSIPIQMYLQRSDLWNENVKENDLDNIEIGLNIMLKHAYIIFKGLNENVNNGQKPEDDTNDSGNNGDEQNLNQVAWHERQYGRQNTTANNTTTTVTNQTKKKKAR